MKLLLQTPENVIDRFYFIKRSLSLPQLIDFENALKRLLARVNSQESEENYKNIFADFLKESSYKNKREINAKGIHNIDLAIFNGEKSTDTVGVIIEAKKPKNITEMITLEKPNVRALHELLLYFFRERVNANNLEIKNLVATNTLECFIFDAKDFEELFYQNTPLLKAYKSWDAGDLSGDKTKFFYDQIAKPFFENNNIELPCVYVRLSDLATLTYEELVPYYKLFSAEHLLKEHYHNDSNTLNKGFYNELLHILGLEEISDGNKQIIVRKAKNRYEGSLMENAIQVLLTNKKYKNVARLADFGDDLITQNENIALELCITWLNRILFLKLLEGQLLRYHKEDTNFAFMNAKRIKSFQDLNELFFDVLAIKVEDRVSKHILKNYAYIPYLNSSLFEITQLEQETLLISNLKDKLMLPTSIPTILKDQNNKPLSKELNILEYLFGFLDAYNFASEDTGIIQKETKEIISASVLGLIFEKINGYKDGSFFTPGFVTMYMCKHTLQQTVIQKFKEKENDKINSFESVKAYISGFFESQDILRFNKIINQITVCDPAVGSGHFLVSVLNEIIALKSELNILADKNGLRLPCKVEVQNDELIIMDKQTKKVFEYDYQDADSQLIQTTIFYEKQRIIENSLFGVDINPNSVKICRLRLWIELLKNSPLSPLASKGGTVEDTKSPLTPKGGTVQDTNVFKAPFGGLGANDVVMETLPNLDINIKTGDSLLSRFKITGNSRILKNQTKNLQIIEIIRNYKEDVFLYFNSKKQEEKTQIKQRIEIHKNLISDLAEPHDEILVRIRTLRNELQAMGERPNFHTLNGIELEKWYDRKDAMVKELKEKQAIWDEKNRTIYLKAFEWRYEFPEILDNNGNFLGFDMVVGNPPYGIELSAIQQETLNKMHQFNTTETAILFVKNGYNLAKPDGFLSYIIPKAYTYASNYEKIRNFTKNELQLLVDCGKVWTDVKIEVCIFQLSKNQPKDTYNSLKMVEKLPVFLSKIDKNLIETFGFFPNGLLQQEIEIGINVRENCQNLNDIADNIPGVPNQKYITDKFESGKTYFDMIGGAEISRYVMKGIKGKIEEKYLTGSGAFVVKNSVLAQNIIAHIKYPTEHIKITASIPLDKHIGVVSLANTINQIIIKEEFAAGISNKFLWALLNSTFVNWYCYNFIYAKAVRTMHFYNAVTSRLPVPQNITQEMQKPIITLVEEILALKTTDVKADTSVLDAQLDALVYALYGLGEEDIKIVEGRMK